MEVRAPIGRYLTGLSHALVVDPVLGRPVGMVSTHDVAWILGWGRG